MDREKSERAKAKAKAKKKIVDQNDLRQIIDET